MSTQPPPPPPPSPDPKPSSRSWLFEIVAIVVLIAIVYAGWKFLTRQKTSEDLVAASHENALGIGWMEHFDYSKAVGAFENATKLAPQWVPAKINLGIALLNDGGADGDAESKSAKLKRALDIFDEILKTDPDNIYALHCSGIIYQDRGQLEKALGYFEAVTRLDPKDSYAWAYRGKCRADSSESPESLKCFETALKLNPNLNSARYAVMQHASLASDPKRKQALLDEWEKRNTLQIVDWYGDAYTEMGRYAEVIGKAPAPHPDMGRLPMFETVKPTVTLAPGTVWSTPDKLDELRRLVRSRFGGAVILLDYNRDGKLDILLLSAVIRNGEVHDLLLRNDGDNKFTDVTAEVGLANHPGSFGGAAGDFNNDEFADLALAGPTGIKLFRNNAGKKFEDETAIAKFDKEPGAYLTVAWADLDQDGDLDLLAAKYAQTPELALKQLKGEKVEGNGRLSIFVNTGVAPPVPKGHDTAPISTAFRPAAELEAVAVKGPVTGIIVTDVDGRKDIDIVALLDGQPPVTLLNDRLMRFHRGDQFTTDAGNWNGGFVLEANGDDQSDFVLVDPSLPPKILISKRDDPEEFLKDRFKPGETDSPPLRSASWVDLDLDGHTDIVGLSSERKPIFLQGDGKGKFVKRGMPFGPDADSMRDLLAVLPFNIHGDGNPDILCWSETTGLQFFRSLGNGNNYSRVILKSVRNPDKKYILRTNADSVGCWVRLHAGPLSTAAENTTFTAGLGQSRLPITFGIGRANTVDAVRVRWPDATPQGEVSQPAGNITILEINRKPDSCPTLFLWDGERFVFLTDCLGAGSMGEMEADGSTRPPRPEESVKIEPGKLVPKNGKFVLKIGEPMDEVLYLDRLQLDVIDHPAGVSVFPDERFATADPQPTQERLFFRNADRIFPIKATDHRGKDVTAILRERDGKTVDDFATRSWLGFAEDHFVELDFQDRIKTPATGQKLYLVLAGWTDYPYPESIFAANQAGIPTIWPVLEQKQADGSWKKLGEIGLPAGLPRVMTTDVSGWIDPKGGPVRIRTNLQIYWDQIFLAPIAAGVETSTRELQVSRASLEHRGFVQEYSPDGKPPVAYDYDRLEPVVYTKWRGRLTRTGDVTELLTKDDDHFVLCGPGDEITAEFDAATLPPLKPGWERSFVLRTWGYCKDTALATATSGQVEPLPFRAMSRYPYDPAKEPLPTHVVEYDRKWNTRPAGGR
jgi:tetratricopeptide (TPR) repeat protein